MQAHMSGRQGHDDGALRPRRSHENRALFPITTSAAREIRLQEEMRENTLNIAVQAKAIQPKNTKRKNGAVQKEWIVRLCILPSPL